MAVREGSSGQRQRGPRPLCQPHVAAPHCHVVAEASGPAADRSIPCCCAACQPLSHASSIPSPALA
eukprot:15440789-Alexandrium_andersonii.AAC.1